MNSSPLQKASFVLLVAILGCLIVLIVQNRREQRMMASLQNPAAMEESIPSQENELKPTPPAFAPLKPRVPTQTPKLATSPTNVVSAHLPSTEEILPERDRGLPYIPGSSRVVHVEPTTSGFTGEAPSISVVGRVTLRGTPPPEKRVTLDPTCGGLHPTPMFTRHYVVGKDDGLANVLVYIKSGAPPVTVPRPLPLLDQVACEFQPYVMGVQTGEVFTVRNSDPVLHNVHTLPTINRERNVGQPLRGMVTKMSFTKPEVFVRFKCDVHPWMFAFVGAVEHHWFTTTDKDGNFALPPGLAPGRYTLAAVHPKSGELNQEITITGGDNPPVNFTFEVPAPLATQ